MNASEIISPKVSAVKSENPPIINVNANPLAPVNRQANQTTLSTNYGKLVLGGVWAAAALGAAALCYMHVNSEPAAPVPTTDSLPPTIEIAPVIAPIITQVAGQIFSATTTPSYHPDAWSMTIPEIDTSSIWKGVAAIGLGILFPFTMSKALSARNQWLRKHHLMASEHATLLSKIKREKGEINSLHHKWAKEALQKLKDQHTKEYNKIWPHLNEVVQKLQKLKKGLFSAKDSHHDFHAPSFDVVSAFLIAMYTGSVTGRSDCIGDGYRYFCWEHSNEFVHSYLTLCLDHLPQEMINTIAENTSVKLKKGDKYDLDESDKIFYSLLWSRANHASQNMLLCGAFFNDAAIMQRCLANRQIDRFYTVKHKGYQSNPLQIASQETLEKIMKMGVEAVLRQEEIAQAREIYEKLNQLTIEFFERLPKVANCPKDLALAEDQAKQFSKCLKNSHFGRLHYHRYLAYDHSLVQKGSEVPYYHANEFEIIENQKLVMMEAPTKQTVAAFWEMMVKTETDHILMLNQFDSADKQSYRYLEKGVYGKVTVEPFEDISIEFREDGCELIKSRIKVICDGKVKILTHWRVDGWPDASVISAKFLAKLNVFFADFIKRGEKIAVHCMAGIGRTGTFVATLKGYLDHSLGKKTTPFDASCATRQARHGAIQTLDQYKLVYETMAITTRDEVPQVQVHNQEKEEKE